MKHSVTFSLLFLTIVAISAASFLGCDTNPAMSARYEAERLLHEADRLAEKAAVRPELNPEGTVEGVRDAYGRVVKFGREAISEIDSAQFPDEYRELCNILYHGTVRHAQFLFQERRFDTCTALFRDLLDNRMLTRYQRMYTRLNLGQSLQANGEWEPAVEMYNTAVEEYYPPLTPGDEQIVFKLFNVPTHVFRIYSTVGDTADARLSFLRAETYYRELIQDFPNTRLETTSRTSLASLHDMAGDVEGAIRQLAQLTDSTGNLPIPVELQIAELEAGRQGDFRAALQRYERILGNMSDDDSTFLPITLFRKAMALLELDQFAEARLILTNLETDHPRFFEQNPTAQLVKAKTFELQGNWDRAITEYRFLIENYDRSDDAFATFLHLERHFASEGRKAEADRWFERGLAHCDEIMARAAGEAGRPTRAKALIYKADLYRQREMWPEAAEVLERLCNDFVDTGIGQRALLAASNLHRERLNQPEMADSLLQVYKSRATGLEESL